jgi:DNA-directed RNA polymerase subunit K/omega
MERLEQIIAKALNNLKGDNYLLALIVAQRSEQLAKGSEPLLSREYMKRHQIIKPVDIAIHEIAEDKLDYKVS